MARRKRQLLEDDITDSDDSNAEEGFDESYGAENADTRAERELFENPYAHKRRRKNGKEDNIYGVFADSDEDEGFSKTKNGRAPKRNDWTKAPSFVSGQKVELDKTLDADVTMEDADEASEGNEEENAEDEEGQEDQSSEDDADEEDEEPSKAPSPRVGEEEEEERPRFGGLGLGASNAGIGSAKTPSAFSGFSKGGIGSFRSSGGLGFKPSSGEEPEPKTVTPDKASLAPTTDTLEPEDLDLPTSFGRPSGASSFSTRPQRAFVRDGSGSGTGTPRPAQLSAKERVHFAKIGGSFGAKMLEKMGWTAGTGLGVEGEGIVTPVESKLRPKGAGIAFGGFKEKTEQSKAEARRRGEVISDDEENVKPRKGRKTKGEEPKERSDAWKKPKKAKRKVEHKTYEEIIAEAGQEAPAGIGQIIDATGATPREVASLADVSIASWTPTADATRLPEIRHNLRLITEACKNDLDGLAREARALEERKKFLQQEDLRLRKKVEEEAELIARLQQVHLVVDDIGTQAKQAASMYEVSLDPFSAGFEKLVQQYPGEFDRYRLDEIVVAAIAPVIRRMLTQWRPLEDPDAFVSSFRLWRDALKMAKPEEPQQQVQTYGSSTVVSAVPVVDKPMTPYESLIWNAWLPKVRSCINNDWSPDDPQPAVRLYEAWSRYLPPFVRDNFFDQLVLPKVHKAVGDWNPRKHSVSLQTMVFPWLPHVGLRLEEVLGDARRKIKSLLRSWLVADGVPSDLATWKEVFDAGEWDAMLLKYIVPKLGARLRDDFRINPRKQDMQPLQDVLLWEKLLRSSILSQLLETEFFPKWLDTLHIWLIQPTPSFEEIAQWYSFWKGSFTENVQNMPGVAQGFTRGLQLMNKAIELGPDAPTQLPRPDHRARAASPKPPGSRQGTPKPRLPARTQEITFRSIVEDFASSHNLLFIPTGKTHEKSRMPLYRVSLTADGKGGLLVYILDDAVWAPDGDEYRAIALEDMVLRATKGSV